MTGLLPPRNRWRNRTALVAAGIAALSLTMASAPAAGAATIPTAPAAPVETAPAPTPAPAFGLGDATIAAEAGPPTTPELRAGDANEPAPTTELNAAAIGPPAVTVSPTTGLNPAGGSSVSVSGSGFDPAANNKFGVYAVFGPVDPGTYFKDANRFLAAVWLHPGGGASGSPGQGELSSNGTFSMTLPALGGLALTAQYTDGNGAAVDCMTTQCYIITMAAHGVPDRSQDTCTPVSFAGATAVVRVDSRCQPVAAPTGQPNPSAPGSTPNPGSTGSTGVNGTAAGTGNGSTGSSGRLPSTGSGSAPAAAIGLALLIGGLGLVRYDRRNRKSTGASAVTH